MNTVRKILDSNYEEVKDAIHAAYEAVGAFQTDRNNSRKRDEMLATIAHAAEVLRVFKVYIPAYKQRYFDIVEHHAALGLSARDLIMAFDRMVFELHTRIEAGMKHRPDFDTEAWSPLMLELLNGRREIQAYAAAAQIDAAVFVASGQSIVGGYVAAPAYRADSVDELKRIPQGSLLLSKMATPDFIIALDNIAGIANEQGGKVCHAAILAREFQIPCIVGCGRFMDAVENGDILILDATNGIVLRQIKENNT